MFLADTLKTYIGLFSFSQVSHSLESIESLNVNKNQQYCFQIYREGWMIDRYIIIIYYIVYLTIYLHIHFFLYYLFTY